MARAKTESVFLTELKNSLEAVYPDGFWHKIQDMPVYVEDKNKKGKDKMRFMINKPFDAIWGFGGCTTAVEGKAHKGLTAWALSDVKKHQLEALEKWERTKQPAVIIVNVRYGLGKKRVNLAFILEPAEIRRYQKQGKKSLKIDELRQYPTMSWDPKNKLWDVPVLIDDIPLSVKGLGVESVGALAPGNGGVGQEGVFGASQFHKSGVQSDKFRCQL